MSSAFWYAAERVTNWPPYWRPYGKPSRLTYFVRKIRIKVRTRRLLAEAGPHEHRWTWAGHSWTSTGGIYHFRCEICNVYEENLR